MSNSIFDWPASLNRFVRFTTAKAEDVNAALDGLSAGLDGVEADFDRSIKIPTGGPDQVIDMAPGVRAGLTLAFDASGNITAIASGGRWRGDWLTATSYVAQDYYQDPVGGDIYVVLLAHTSSNIAADVAANKSRLAIYVSGVEADRVLAEAAAVTATTKAGEASASSVNAAASELDAASSLAQVESMFSDFDTRYLGSKALPPALDNEGNALAAGALYFDTAAGEMRAWSGSAWVAAYLPASGYATLNGTETLQNKTLSSPVITRAVAVVATNTTAQPSTTYAMTSAMELLAFPSPQPGQWFGFVVVGAGTSCTIGYNDQPIEGDASDFNLDDERAQGCCIYVSVAAGWRIIKF